MGNAVSGITNYDTKRTTNDTAHQTSIPSTGTYKPPTCVSIPPTPQRPATPFSGLMSPNTRTFETDLPHGASVQAMGDAPPRVEVNQSRLQSRDYTTRSDHGGSTVPQTLRGVNPPSSEQNTNLVEPEVPDFLDFTNVHEAFDDFLSLHSNFGGSPVVTKKGDSRKPPPSVQVSSQTDSRILKSSHSHATMETVSLHIIRRRGDRREQMGKRLDEQTVQAPRRIGRRRRWHSRVRRRD